MLHGKIVFRLLLKHYHAQHKTDMRIWRIVSLETSNSLSSRALHISAHFSVDRAHIHRECAQGSRDRSFFFVFCFLIKVFFFLEHSGSPPDCVVLTPSHKA
jgi:hypothetical protein